MRRTKLEAVDYLVEQCHGCGVEQETPLTQNRQRVFDACELCCHAYCLGCLCPSGHMERPWRCRHCRAFMERAQLQLRHYIEASSLRQVGMTTGGRLWEIEIDWPQWRSTDYEPRRYDY